MSFTDTSETMLLNWMFTDASAPSRPTAWQVSLHTGDPGETGLTAEVLVSADADYTRKAITFADSVAGSSCLSELAVTHTPASGATAYTVTHVTVHATAPDAVALISGALQVPQLIDNSNPLSLSVGEIVIAIS